MPLVRWLVAGQFFAGVFAFDGDLAQADVFESGPDEAHWSDAEEGDQKERCGAGCRGLG